MERWKRTDDPRAEDYHIFRLRRHTAVSPRTGASGRYVSLEAPDWVNMIALTTEGQVIVVEQYRHGTDSVSLEIPSGMVDHGEEPRAAAARELAEETGYSAERWIDLGMVEPNPAFQNNHCYSYLATGCRPNAQQQFDAGEDIAVHLMPLQEVGRLIQDGTIRHALIVVAFFRYLQIGQPCGPLFPA